MARKLKVSSHAAFRWVQRVEESRGLKVGQSRLSEGRHNRTRSRIQKAFKQSVPIPKRFVQRLASVRIRHWNSARYYMTTRAVLVVQGSSVVTILPWSLEQFVTVMVHQIFGIWPEPPPPPPPRH